MNKGFLLGEVVTEHEGASLSKVECRDKVIRCSIVSIDSAVLLP